MLPPTPGTRQRPERPFRPHRRLDVISAAVWSLTGPSGQDRLCACPGSETTGLSTTLRALGSDPSTDRRRSWTRGGRIGSCAGHVARRAAGVPSGSLEVSRRTCVVPGARLGVARWHIPDASGGLPRAAGRSRDWWSRPLRNAAGPASTTHLQGQRVVPTLSLGSTRLLNCAESVGLVSASRGPSTSRAPSTVRAPGCGTAVSSGGSAPGPDRRMIQDTEVPTPRSSTRWPGEWTGGGGSGGSSGLSSGHPTRTAGDIANEGRRGVRQTVPNCPHRASPFHSPAGRVERTPHRASRVGRTPHLSSRAAAGGHSRAAPPRPPDMTGPRSHDRGPGPGSVWCKPRVRPRVGSP